MQQDNGWFQMELHKPVKSKKTEKKEISSERPENKPDIQNQILSNNFSNNTYGQNPIYENTLLNPIQNNIPKPENSDIKFSQQQENKGDGRTTAVKQNTNRSQTKISYSSIMNQYSIDPMIEEGNIPGDLRKPNSNALLWDEDRVLSTQHSQTVGQRGPVLEQDSTLHETLEIFINEKIPERPVHVKGSGALGYFQTINSMREYTSLSFLQTPGQQVPVMVRFSIAASTKGTPDTTRSARGFSTKFYPQEGIFDLLCNHIPVLFVRDGIRFPEAFTALAPSPVNNLTYPERFWRFVATAPEAMNFITWAYSDVGTIKSYRHMKGFSVNAYVWRNAQGVRRYVKYHWIPLAGEEYIDRQEATMLAGMNPDIAGQDLYDTIAAGTPVQYELYVQLMDPQDENTLPYDPLDCTKIWDEQRYPLIPVGRLTLNQNPDNYMDQVEKVAFSPSNLLDGVELSDDKLLQARANIYWDSQRRRLGEDFRSIPVNSQIYWSPDDQVTSGSGNYVEGHLNRSEIQNPDNFTQAGEHYNSLSPNEKDHLIDNLASDLVSVSQGVQNVVLSYLYSASTELGQRVASQISVYSR